MSTAVVGGIDGCPAGWLLATAAVDARLVTTRVFGSIGELLATHHDLATIAIDIPIGLTTDGPRPPDLAARSVLGPRASSVFPAPVRDTLHAASYQDASDRSFAAHGKRLSKQTFALLPKIREVDVALRSSDRDRTRVFEIHPEVSFYLLNHEQPMPHPKRTGLGFTDRKALIEAHFPGAFEVSRRAHARSHVADDDILDALAALWSAGRLHAGQARSFPEGAIPRDSVGLPMAIWA